MANLIDRQALYERAATLEAQALDYVGKLIERDGDETSTEWRIWSAILIERTAFKHDVYDAPSVDVQPVRHGRWIEFDDAYNLISGRCSVCGWESHLYEDDVVGMPYCPNCGAHMEGSN